MSIYTVTQIGRNDKAVAGAPTRKYRAESPSEAAALYVAAAGLRGAELVPNHIVTDAAERFTFLTTTGAGSPISVHVEEVERTNESFGGLTAHADAYTFGLCLRYARSNGIDYWALTLDEKFALEDAARNGQR